MKTMIIMFLLSAIAVSDTWEASSYTDPMTDEVSYSVACYSDDVTTRMGDRPCLLIDPASLWISAEEFLGSDEIRVTIRLDDNEPRTMSWRISNDHKSMGIFNLSESYINEILHGETLLIRYTPYSESTRTASWNLEGLLEAASTVPPWEEYRTPPESGKFGEDGLEIQPTVQTR